MIAPVGPLDHCLVRVAPAEHQVTGIEAESDVGPVKQLTDLLGRFDVARAVMMEGRFVIAPAAEIGCPVDAVGEPAPAGRIEHQGRIVMRAARRPPAVVGTGIREGGSRRHRGIAFHAVEDIEQTAQLGQRGRHPIRLGERHRDVTTGEMKATFVKSIRQLPAISEVAGRSEVDAGVPGARHRIEHRQRIGDMWIDADCDFKGAERHRCAGDGDRWGQRRHAAD